MIAQQALIDGNIVAMSRIININNVLYGTSVVAQDLLTGDTLFIRGTGRTDFQQGDSRAQYDSLFNKLLRLPEDTMVYPGHDYKGDTVSTIGEEKICEQNRIRLAGALHVAFHRACRGHVPGAG